MAQPTAQTPIDDAPEAAASSAETQPVDELLEEDLLVEDVSIDGMCGVY